MHVRKKGTREEFALKQINKRFIVDADMTDQIRKEVVYMHNLTKKACPFIVKLIDHFEDQENVYLIMEYLKGGQLMDLVKEYGKLKESVVCHIIRDVILGIAAMHENKLIHRDIKPENILLSEKGTAKLADFGWSNSIDTEATSRKTYCGTADYLAPEIIQGKEHDDSVDLWCLGVLIFELLFGYAPFSPQSVDPSSYDYQPYLEKKILKVDYTIPKHVPVSKEAVDLIYRLLREKPKERMRIPDIVKHKWFKRFDISFDIQTMEHEPVNLDLGEYMRKNCYHDPFANHCEDQADALESEIKAERLYIEKEKRKKLRNLKHLGNDYLEVAGDCLSPTSPHVKRTSKSAEYLASSEKEALGKVIIQEVDSNQASKKFHRYNTERDPHAQMRIIYKDAVAVIPKDYDGLEETLMDNINRLTGYTSNSFNDTDLGQTSESPSFRKSQLMIEEIDKEYDRFEAMPVDVGTQTVPEILIRLPHDPRTQEILRLQKKIDDLPIILQMLDEQKQESQFNVQRLKQLKSEIDNLNVETARASQKTIDLMNINHRIEEQISVEAQTMGSLIQGKQKRIDDLKAQRDNLLSKIQQMKS